MPTIAYYVVFKPDEKELESLNRLGDHSRAQGYRFHEGKWYRRIGMMPASDACAKEAKDRPLTMEEIKSWVE